MPRARQLTAYLLFVFSGAAGLGYQMVWSRMFSTGLGHETPAMLAIVCAFMGGMALGAWAFDGRISRSANPGRWYAGLELIIGLWAFASIALIAPANALALRLIGIDPSPLQHWFAAFVIPTVVLLPATAAMGATFPAMERFVVRLAANERQVGAVYGANTFGAVVGILASTFVIAPALGFSRAVAVLGLVNVLCAAVAFRLARECARVQDNRCNSSTHPGIHSSASPELGPGRARLTRTRLLATVCATGFLGIGYEVAGVRVLAQVLENTIYTFAAVLSVYLLGTSLGAMLYQRRGNRWQPDTLLGTLLAVTTLSIVPGVLALSRAQPIYATVRGLGDHQAAVLVAEMTVAAIVFLLPAVAMGATFSHIAQLLRASGAGVGRAAALNTLGGAFAPVAFGVALLPLIGSKWTLVLGAFAYLLMSPRFGRTQLMPGVAAAALVLLLPANLHVVSVPPGGKVVAFREGVMAAVSVVEDASGQRVLRVNNRFQMGGTSAADAEYRQAHLPLLLHPAPRRALFLGVGTGITVGGALLHPGLAIDGVELVPEIVEFVPLFEPANRSARRATNCTIHVADARRFIRVATHQYDVIVADLFHPARDGAGALYTEEHFRAVRARLAPNGLFCQWLPLHQLDGRMFATISRTFARVFPESGAFLLRFNVDAPVIGLIGMTGQTAFSANWIEGRVNTSALEAEAKRLALADSLRFFGHFVANGTDLGRSGLINQDDHPHVTFGAPSVAYAKAAKPYATLLRAIDNTARGRAAQLLDLGMDDALARELQAFTTARDVYLHGLAQDYEGHRDAAIEAYIRSAGISPDFTAGYAQCLTIASLLAKSDPQKARNILERLIEAQPERPVARELLNRLTADERK